MASEVDTLLEATKQLPCWGRPQRFGPGELVFRAGTPTQSFHIVATGRVKLLKAARPGTPTMLEIVEPGGLLCGNAVYRAEPYCCNAIFDGQGGSTVVVPRERLLRLVDERRGLWRTLMDQVTCRGMMLCERVDEVGRGTVEQRLARLFLRLWSASGVERLGERWLPVRLSRRDLAQLCCSRIETTIRAMTRLERDGVIETAENGFRILDHEALVAKSGEVDVT